MTLQVQRVPDVGVRWRWLAAAYYLVWGEFVLGVAFGFVVLSALVAGVDVVVVFYSCVAFLFAVGVFGLQALRMLDVEVTEYKQ